MKEIKIIFVCEDFQGNLIHEKLRAEKLNENSEYFRVNEIPHFAPNISKGDIISIENDDGELYFCDLIKPSGHSTVQVTFFDVSYEKKLKKILNNIGCLFSNLSFLNLLTIDIPNRETYQELEIFLVNKSREGILDYRESNLGWISPTS